MAARHDITIDQGSTFVYEAVWTDVDDNVIDLTDYKARMQARHSLDSEEAFLLLTTENGGITLDELNGKVILQMTPADTSALPAGGGYYDIELQSGDGVVTRLLEGLLIVSREVTTYE